MGVVSKLPSWKDTKYLRFSWPLFYFLTLQTLPLLQRAWEKTPGWLEVAKKEGEADTIPETEIKGQDRVTGLREKSLIQKNAPCIGLCFHNKLMALEAETAAGAEVPDANELDFSRGWPLNGADFEKPCVGVCQYFRENNMTPAPALAVKPCVGVCAYLREEGLPNPFTPKPIIVDDVEEDILDVSS